jgi:PEP-CTERM motif
VGEGQSQVTFGSQTVIAGGNLNFLDYYGGFAFQPTGTVINDGTVKADRNADTVNINNRYFTNNGLLEAVDGASLSISGVTLFTNSGTVALGNGTIITGSGLTIGDGTLTGSGIIVGNVTLDADPSQLAFNIGGAAQGSGYDFLSINGNIQLPGDLDIAFVDGFQNQITSSESFVVLTATNLTGSFLNVKNGRRLLTTDGLGSFQVNYGSDQSTDEIVLSDYQAVPEPASLGLIMGGTMLLGRRRRSRPRIK